MPQRPQGRRLLLELSLALGLFLLLEGLIFRTDLYPSLLKPKSHSARSYFTLHTLRHRLPEPGKEGVLVMGDSRIAEGFSALIADNRHDPAGLQFFNAANPGTNLRVWYYLLRELDPRASRYAAVLIPMANYDDRYNDERTTAITNISSILPLLHPQDIPAFPLAFQGSETRLRALEAALLKGHGYKRDFQDFLNAPLSRLKEVRQFNQYRYDAAYKYQGRSENLIGLEFDSAQNNLRYPPNHHLSPQEQARLERVVRGKIFNLDATNFIRIWLGRIADHYRSSRTTLMLLRLPPGPLRIDAPQSPNPDSTARTLASQGRLVLMPEGTFDHLGKPQYYFDSLHLNRDGRKIFSQLLADKVAATLQEGTRISSHKPEI